MIVGVLRTAQPLDFYTHDEIAARFSDVLGEHVLLQQVVDPELIAGIQVEVGGRVYDGSVRGQLERISDLLKTGREEDRNA